MKKNTLWILLSFLGGMSITLGLILLDRQASVLRVGPTEIVEVVLPGGKVQHLSYAEIEREREELLSLRQRMSEFQKRPSAPASPDAGSQPAVPEMPDSIAAPAQAPSQGSQQGEPQSSLESKKNLGKFFAKIFSQPIMQDLMTHQVNRQSGELADALDLTQEQKAELEQILKRRKVSFPQGPPSGPAGPAAVEEGRASPKSLEEEILAILTRAQAQRYQEYTEKKNALSGASTVERDVFEMSWRLKLTEEQEKQAREILQVQSEKGRTPPPLSGLQPEGPISERIETYLEKKASLERETSEKMKTILDENQYQAFLAVQSEKEAETQLLRRLLEEEKSAGAVATPGGTAQDGSATPP